MKLVDKRQQIEVGTEVFSTHRQDAHHPVTVTNVVWPDQNRTVMKSWEVKKKRIEERRKIQDSWKKEMFHQILRNQIILTAILWTERSGAAENHMLRQEDREQEKETN